MASQKANRVVVVLALVLLFALTEPAFAAGAEVSRSIGDMPHSYQSFDVVLTISGLEAGGIVETLPAGFTYAGSSLSDDQVKVSGRNVIFSVINTDEITYTVKAPSSGTGVFNGVWYDPLAKVNGSIGETPVIVIDTRGDGGDSDSGSSQESSLPGSSRVEGESSSRLVLAAGESQSATFEDSCISKITLDVLKGSVSTTLVVGAVSLPSNTGEAPGVAYQYLNITAPDMTDANVSATILFRVNRSWIADESIDEETITLYRYNGSWTALPTSFVREDDDYLYFEATSPGFSVFAISGEKAALASVTTVSSNAAAVATKTVTAATVKTPAATETTPVQSAVGVFGSAGGLLGAAALAGWRREMKR
ncbi:MAG: PGF-pre-PGF domain-containing protein [Methanofollis sp.]|uniref:PGF-pre-PGF domain-containing protein n=1 Tax=Methanofollis sp. TaxID=2052835 RepID=UPI0026343ECB|nr:PGF-pre-PGF domain-containing protein [Methanofollis sp.]MDD4254851.1 PGF-pre-PGF domain-containing protein [Methanofollis sp.]